MTILLLGKQRAVTTHSLSAEVEVSDLCAFMTE